MCGPRRKTGILQGIKNRVSFINVVEARPLRSWKLAWALVQAGSYEIVGHFPKICVFSRGSRAKYSCGGNSFYCTSDVLLCSKTSWVPKNEWKLSKGCNLTMAINSGLWKSLFLCKRCLLLHIIMWLTAFLAVVRQVRLEAAFVRPTFLHALRGCRDVDHLRK